MITSVKVAPGYGNWPSIHGLKRGHKLYSFALRVIDACVTNENAVTVGTVTWSA